VAIMVLADRMWPSATKCGTVSTILRCAPRRSMAWSTIAWPVPAETTTT
jgi:hypothetical protein